MFNWQIRYADARGIHQAAVFAANQAAALRLSQIPTGSILEVRRLWGLPWLTSWWQASSPPAKLQLLLLTQVAALLASGDLSKFNQLLQSLPELQPWCAKYPEVWRDDISLSEKLAHLHCHDAVVASITAGEKTGTLSDAIPTAVGYIKQSLKLREHTGGTVYLGAILFVVSLSSFITLPSFLKEPLSTLTQTEGIVVQFTPATHLLILLHELNLVWLAVACLLLAVVSWVFRKPLMRLPPFNLISRWQRIRRSLNFLNVWRPLHLAQVPLSDHLAILKRTLGHRVALELLQGLQKGESLTTILQTDNFSPILALASRGLVESDKKSFVQTVDVLIPVLLEEQKSLSKRMAIFFYTSGIVLTIAVVVMITLGLIFPILGATVAL